MNVCDSVSVRGMFRFVCVEARARAEPATLSAADRLVGVPALNVRRADAARPTTENATTKAAAAAAAGEMRGGGGAGPREDFSE